MAVNMVNPKTNRELRMQRVILVSVIFAGTLIVYAGYYMSNYFLSKAENTNSKTDKLRLLITSDSFWPSDIVQLQIGDIYYSEKDFEKAAIYYSQSLSQEGVLGFAKAKYVVKDYASVISIESKESDLLSAETRFVIAEAYMKTGDLSKAREIFSSLEQSVSVVSSRLLLLDIEKSEAVAESDLIRLVKETDKANRRLLAYNALNVRGFPQAAFALLVEGSMNKELTRDGYLTLAQAQIDKGLQSDAFVALESALAKDAYYPQTYRQLIEIGGKLGKDTMEYKTRLAAMAW